MLAARLPFFLPRRLTALEYVVGGERGEPDPGYRYEQDFAFFAANFGYSKAEYDSLTPRERAFLYKAWEDRLVARTTHIRNAVCNAVCNALRGRGERVQPLWHRRQTAEKEQKQRWLDILSAAQRKEQTDWIAQIYRTERRKGGKTDGRLHPVGGADGGRTAVDRRICPRTAGDGCAP